MNSSNEEIWLRAFVARCTVVVQNQNLVWSAETCAKFADDALKEFQARFNEK